MCQRCAVKREEIVTEIGKVVRREILDLMTSVAHGSSPELQITTDEILIMFQDQLDAIKSDVDDLINGRLGCASCGKRGDHAHKLNEDGTIGEAEEIPAFLKPVVDAINNMVDKWDEERGNR